MALQIIVQLVLVLGWAGWLELIIGRKEQNDAWIAWRMVAGLALQTLLIEAALFFGVPLKLTAFLSLSLAVIGGGCGVWRVLRQENERRTRLLRTVLVLSVVTLAVSIAQGAAWLTHGREHFFGRATYDQANYVLCAEYLGEIGLGSPTDPRSKPWVMRAQESSRQRIAQNVLLEECAILSAGDAQQAWGGVTVLCVWMLAWAAYGLARVYRISHYSSAWLAILVGIIPAISQALLDGFFSQAATLWVFPALIGFFAGGGQPKDRLVLGAIGLGFLLAAYTEFWPIGVGVAALSIPGWNRRECAIVGGALAGAVALNAPYIASAYSFFFQQIGAAQNAVWTDRFFPDSGHWSGFARNFFPAWSPSFLSVAGMGMAGLIVAAVAVVPWPQRRTLVLPLAPFFAALVLVALKHPFSGYAFGKILLTVAPLLVFPLFAAASDRSPRKAAGFLCALVALSGSAAAACYSAQAGLDPQREPIAFADTRARAQEAHERLVLHPELPIVVTSSHPLESIWLGYNLRDQKIYLAYRDFGDRSFPAPQNEFRQLPDWSLACVVSRERVVIERPRWIYPRIEINRATLVAPESQRWTAKKRLSLSALLPADQTAQLRWYCFKISGGAARYSLRVGDARSWTVPGQLNVVPAVFSAGRWSLEVESTSDEEFVFVDYGFEPTTDDLSVPRGFTLLPVE